MAPTSASAKPRGLDASRFAPSPTGYAHPGTLLSALLVWLDARHHGLRAVLRLEDVDHTRSTPAYARAMIDAMEWMGLRWDEVIVQSARRGAHEAALDALAAQGALYACTCSRKDRAGGRRAADGAVIYDNRCRGNSLTPATWREATGTGAGAASSLRVALPAARIELVDEGGTDLSQCPATDYGDPVVRSANGAMSYMLAVVVDDAEDRVVRVVRGRDLALCTATQVALQRLLGYPTPRYRHHPLLLDGAAKLAKLHGSLPLPELIRQGVTAPALCGALARMIGLRATAAPVTPAELRATFSWDLVRSADVAVTPADLLASP